MRQSQEEAARDCAYQMAHAIGMQAYTGEDPRQAKERIERKLMGVYREELMGRDYEEALEWSKAEDSRMFAAVSTLRRWAYRRTIRVHDPDGKRGREVHILDNAALPRAWEMALEVFYEIASGEGDHAIVARDGLSLLADVLRETQRGEGVLES